MDKWIGRPLTVPTGKKFGEDFLEKAAGGRVNLGFLNSTSSAHDPDYVSKRIYITLGRSLRRKKYEVIDPVQVFAHFNTLAYQHQGKEVDLEELAKRVPADAYFFITITHWDSEDFDASGFLRAGYLAQLLEGKTRSLIWENQCDDRLFRIRQNQNNISSFTQFYDEMIDQIALDVLRKFPKKIEPPKVSISA